MLQSPRTAAQCMHRLQRAQEDARRVQGAEKRLARCQERLRQAALSLDRLLVARGDEDGRRRLVEGALRLTANV